MRHLALILLTSALLFTGCDSEEEDDITTFNVTMTGAAEAPGPGDADGTGTAVIRINEDANEVCFDISVSNVETIANAHIHEAPAGEPGGVVVDFQIAQNPDLEGCVASTAAQIREILDNPSDYYVNVHNDPFPAGAVRGQLG